MPVDLIIQSLVGTALHFLKVFSKIFSILEVPASKNLIVLDLKKYASLD
jgi:hypothetical protein